MGTSILKSTKKGLRKKQKAIKPKKKEKADESSDEALRLARKRRRGEMANLGEFIDRTRGQEVCYQHFSAKPCPICAMETDVDDEL